MTEEFRRLCKYLFHLVKEEKDLLQREFIEKRRRA
jgi:hypothetical protein